MLIKIILIFCCVGCCLSASAQTDIERLSEKYISHKRDIKVVKEYVEALEKANRMHDAEMVAKEYMSRCPVLQMEDKDTYLLLSKYLFTDPYSNIFEYGLYAFKKFKWQREEDKNEQKHSMKTPAFWMAMRMGVSGADEVDKRYEALNLMSNNLSKEITRQCTPQIQNGHYVMPEYSEVRMKRLQHMVDKGELLGLDAMRARLAIARAIHEGRYSEVLNDMMVLTSLQMADLDGNYIIGILSVLSSHQLDDCVVRNMISMVHRLSEKEERIGGGINYYNLLGRLYGLVGELENAEKYKTRGETIDAQRREQYKDLYDIFEDR